MRCILVLEGVLLAVLAPGSPQEVLPDALVKDLKAATVLIRSARPDGAFVCTSFLIRKDATSGYVATASAIEETLHGNFEAVFHSGAGKQELVVPAKLVARSTDGLFAVTVFKVPAKSLPKPIELSKAAIPRETLRVFRASFSIREGSFTRGGRPLVTLTPGAVSGLRKDDAGGLVAIQLDISAAAGQAGSPVVDSKGAFVGVTIGSVWGTNISLLCPPEFILETMKGRIEEARIEERENSDGRIAYEVVAVPADPMENLKTVALLLAPRPRGAAMAKPPKPGVWVPVFPDMIRLELKRTDAGWSGLATVKGDVKEDVDYVGQVQWTRADGASFTGPPHVFLAEFPLGDPERKRARREWIGNEAPAAPEEPGKAAPGLFPEPAVTGEVLRGTSRVHPPLKVTPLLYREEWLARNSVISEDGKSLYLLDKAGLLLKISLPDLVEERRLVIGKPCTWLDRSRAGLMLLLHESQDLWVVDEATLKVKKRIGVGVLSYVTSSPAAPYAYGYGPRMDLHVIDLEAGKIVNRIPTNAFTIDTSPKTVRHLKAQFLTRWDPLAVSADGKYVFVDSGCVHRFRIEGVNLECEEIGPPLGWGGLTHGMAHSPGALVLSPDSKSLALRVSDNRFMVEDVPPLPDRYGTYFFRTADLRKPIGSSSSWIWSLDIENRPGFAIDRKTNKLQTVDPAGTVVSEMDLQAGQMAYLTFHANRDPLGRGWILFLNGRVLWVEFEK